VPGMPCHGAHIRRSDRPARPPGDRLPKGRPARALFGASTCDGGLGSLQVVQLPDWIALMRRDCPRRRSPGLAECMHGVVSRPGRPIPQSPAPRNTSRNGRSRGRSLIIGLTARAQLSLLRGLFPFCSFLLDLDFLGRSAFLFRKNGRG